MRHKGLSPENEAPRTFTLRSHALQVKLPVLSLDGADLTAWTAWDTKTGQQYKIAANGLKMQLRGRWLVVSIPKLALEASEDTIQAAVGRVRDHVAEYVTVARKLAHERHGVQAGGPARWYRDPDFALECFPGVPEGVRYTVKFWVDSSLGPAEVESSKVETIKSLMAVGNEISLALSKSTF